MAFDYEGIIVPIPLGMGGQNNNRNLTLIPPTDLISALNLSFRFGMLEREGGSVKINTTAISGTPTITALWDYFPTPGTQRLVVATSDGKLFKDDDDNFGTELKTGLGTNKFSMFVEAGAEATANDKKLFHFNGNDVVQVLAADGATTANISTPPADWATDEQPTGGVVHNGRLWAWSKHLIYASLIADHEDFTAAGTLTFGVFSGEGERIIAARSIRGRLFIWKYPHGLYWLNDDDTNVANWTIKKLSSSIGGASPLCHVEVDNDVVFMDANGKIHALSAVDELGDMRASDLTSSLNVLPFLDESMNRSRTNFVQAVYYPIKREAHFVVTGAGASENNRRLVFDFNLQAPRWRWSDKDDVCASIALRRDGDDIQVPIIGDDVGVAWTLDATALNIGGTGAYRSEFQTPHIDFSHDDQIGKLGKVLRKDYDFLEFTIIPEGAHDMIVDVFHDGELAETIAFNMGPAGFILDSSLLDIDKFGGVLTKVRHRLHGASHRFSVRGVITTPDDAFSIVEMAVYLRMETDKPVAQE